VDASVLARVEHVDARARRVSGRESERERATLVSELIPRLAQTDERASVQDKASAAVAAYAPNAPAAFENVKGAWLAFGSGHMHRLAKLAYGGEPQRAGSGGRLSGHGQHRGERAATKYCQL